MAQAPQYFLDDNEISKEIERLNAILEDIPSDKFKVAEGLIVQAARLRVMLNQMYEDIRQNGDTELFTQSPNTPPYERERPVARLFNNRTEKYLKTMSQLQNLLGDEKEEEDDGFEEFLEKR